MQENKGFIELRNVEDYWKKLQFDLSYLKKNKDDTYAAFNFFVTAYHLIDWIFEGQYPEERIDLNKKPVMKLCNHIANGIKHFQLNPDRHKSVKKIEKERYFKEGYIEDGYIESPIIIYLDEMLKSSFGEVMGIIDLADHIIDFWEAELAKRNLI